MNGSVGERTWPRACDNDTCAGPVQPEEAARAARSAKQYIAWSVVFWLVTAAALALTAATYFAWPDPGHVPVYMGRDGVDRWGTRTEALVAVGVGTGVMVLCGPVLAWVMPKFPMGMTNAAHEAYWKTPERWPLQHQHTRAFHMAVMSCAQLLLLAVSWGFWRVAHGAQFPDPPMYASLAVLAVSMAAGIVMLLRAMKPPAWWFDCRKAHGHRWD